MEIQKAFLGKLYANNDSAGMARAEKSWEELQKRIDGYNNENKIITRTTYYEEYTQQLALTLRKVC